MQNRGDFGILIAMKRKVEKFFGREDLLDQLDGLCAKR